MINMSSTKRSKVKKVSLSARELSEIKKHEEKDGSLSCSIRRRSRRSIVRNFRAKEQDEEVQSKKGRLSHSGRHNVPTFADNDMSNEKLQGIEEVESEKAKEQLQDDNPSVPCVTSTNTSMSTQARVERGKEIEENSLTQDHDQLVREAIAMCVDETSKWQALFQQYKDMASEEKSEGNTLPDDPQLDGLTNEERDILATRMDLTKIVKESKEIVNDLKIQMVNVQSAVTLCSKYKDIAKSYIQEQITMLGYEKTIRILTAEDEDEWGNPLPGVIVEILIESKSAAETGVLKTPRTLIRSLQSTST